MFLKIMQLDYYSDKTFLSAWTSLISKLELPSVINDGIQLRPLICRYKNELERIKKVPFVEWRGINIEVAELRNILIELIKLHGYKDEIDCCKQWFDKIKLHYGKAYGTKINWYYNQNLEKQIFANYYNSYYDCYIDKTYEVSLSDIEYIAFISLDASNGCGYLYIEY